MLNNNISKTFYFSRKRKKKIISHYLNEKILFTDTFIHKNNIYLENEKYLIIISKKFIRVVVFNYTSNADILDIKETIKNINMGKT